MGNRGGYPVMPLMEVKDLSVAYRKERPILDGINLEINSGQCIIIKGHNGSGKSTLAKALAGVYPYIEKPYYEGHLYVHGESIQEVDKYKLWDRVGIIFQEIDTQIFSSQVMDELAFGLENYCKRPEEIQDRIHAVAEKLEINRIINSNTKILSGGEKQKVVLASLLCMDKDVLVLDEALNQLDTYNYGRVEAVLKQWCQDGKALVWFTHHDVDWAHHHYILDDGKLQSV